MEHYYSLTGRMLAIFVGGLIVLGILLFVAGLLAGRQWGASEAVERLGAAKHSPASAMAPAAKAAAPAAVPASSPPSAAAGTGTAAGAIRPVAALPSPSAAPALPRVPTVPRAPSLPAAPRLPSTPAAPKLPSMHAAPTPPSMPAAPKLPLPTRSSQANPARNVATAGLSREAGAAPAAMQASRANPENTSSENGAGAQNASAGETDTAVQGFVVYVGAFESGAKAENIAQKLRARNLAAQTSPVARPGHKPLVTVWVGPFDDHAGAEAAIPDIHAAGLKDTMIREVP